MQADAIPPEDVQLLVNAAHCVSPEFAAQIGDLYAPFSALSGMPGVTHLSIDAQWDFSEWPGNPVWGISNHVCQCPPCHKDRAQLTWKEEPLKPANIQRVLGGIRITAVEDESEAAYPVAGALKDDASKNLDELVAATHALFFAPLVETAAEAIRKISTLSPMEHFGFYMIVAVVGPGPMTDVVFHWCTAKECEERAAVGRHRPRSFPQLAAPPVRVCGWAHEHVVRARPPVWPGSNPWGR